MTAASPPLLERWARLRCVWTIHGRGSAAFACLESSDPAVGMPGATSVIGLWLSMGTRLTVVFLTFSVLARV